MLVRDATLDILALAQPWVAETVNKYWSDPELYLGEMLEMLKSMWRSRSQRFYMGADFEEQRSGVQFWNES